MSMRPKLYSLSALSIELNLNPRTLARRLKRVPSDGKIGGHSAWFLATALRATQADYEPGPSGSGEAINAELMALGQQIDAGFKEMRAERDIARRRVMAERVGPLIGWLDKAFARSLETIPEASRAFTRIGINSIMGGTIGELMFLCDWTLAKDDVATG
jgi:hypothetical protein